MVGPCKLGKLWDIERRKKKKKKDGKILEGL